MVWRITNDNGQREREAAVSKNSLQMNITIRRSILQLVPGVIRAARTVRTNRRIGFFRADAIPQHQTRRRPATVARRADMLQRNLLCRIETNEISSACIIRAKL